jgi:hypothetical protein
MARHNSSFVVLDLYRKTMLRSTLKFRLPKASTSTRLFTHSSIMEATQKKASIVVVGIPWDDDRIHHQIAPEKLKAGIEMIDRMMQENGFVHHQSVQ